MSPGCGSQVCTHGKQHSTQYKSNYSSIKAMQFHETTPEISINTHQSCIHYCFNQTNIFYLTIAVFIILVCIYHLTINNQPSTNDNVNNNNISEDSHIIDNMQNTAGGFNKFMVRSKTTDNDDFMGLHSSHLVYYYEDFSQD